jgi:dipeptidyl aminopeptidase/acylaminoacyl peptidase
MRVQLAIAQLPLFFSGFNHPTLAQPALVAWKTQVWKIDSAGAIDRLTYDFGGPTVVETMQGTTAPLVSPDQKTIAFTRGNDLWLLELSSMRATRATTIGWPSTSEFASVFVLITAWSPDSRKILYRIEKGETEDPEGDSPDLKVRPTPYGDYIYDVEKQASAAVSIPGQFLAWIPGDGFLIKTGEFKSSRLVCFRPRENNGQQIAASPGDYGQVRTKPGGEQIVALRGSEIVLVDLRDGNAATLATGKWAEFQFPTFSPSGKHIAYIRQYPLATRGWYGHQLFVDGARVYDSDKDLSYDWIDDEVIAILRFERDLSKEPTWILIDLKTGKEKTTHPIT